MKKILKKICTLTITAAIALLPAGAAAASGDSVSNPDSGDLISLQEEKLELLEENAGEYAPDSFVLEDTNREEAEYAASMIDGSELRMNEAEDFAVIYLPEDVSVEDVYSDDSMADLLPKMTENHYISLMDTDAQGNTLTPAMPDYELTDDKAASQKYLSYINLRDTWTYTKGDGVTVAIIDTGIDVDNSEFQGKISEDSFNASTNQVVGTDGIDVIDDPLGHGTKVASVIAASMDGTGVVGIAPGVELLVIKFAVDSSGNITFADVVLGLQYAVSHGADIINMSFGTNEDCMGTYTKAAAEQGVILIASAGNDGSDVPVYPASDPDVIGVGALASSSWKIASYSTYGIGTLVMAPGTVYTTTRTGTYQTSNGTSFAGPVVAAAAALYVSYHGKTSPAQMQELLKASSTDLGDPGADNIYGYGVLNIYDLVFGETGTATFKMQADGLEDETRLIMKAHVCQDYPDPERDGYKLTGWYLDQQLADGIDSSSYVFAGDTTLYAGWTPIIQFDSYTLGGAYDLISYTTLNEIPDGSAVFYKDRQMYLKDGSWYCAAASGEEPEADDFSVAGISEDESAFIDYETISRGDINENGRVSIVDAQIAYDISCGIYTGFEKLSYLGVLAADYNGDLEITAADARAIQYLIHTNGK